MCAVAFAWVCLRLRVFAGRECLVGTPPARYFLYKSSDTTYMSLRYCTQGFVRTRISDGTATSTNSGIRGFHHTPPGRGDSQLSASGPHSRASARRVTRCRKHRRRGVVGREVEGLTELSGLGEAPEPDSDAVCASTRPRRRFFWIGYKVPVDMPTGVTRLFGRMVGGNNQRAL